MSRLGKRAPYIPQMEAVECGAASLAMILAYWGHHAPLAEVRQACGVSRDGSTARNIIAAARGYGLVGKVRRGEPDGLAVCKHPAILHWRFEHFIVLEKWTPEFVHVIDPAGGRRRVTAKEFDESFTGICMEFEPDTAFVKREAEPKTRARYVELLRGSGSAIGLVLVASLALDLLALVLPVTTQLVVDRVLGGRHPTWLFLLVSGAVALIALNVFYTVARDVIFRRLRRTLDEQIGARFVSHLFKLPIVFFQQRGPADLLVRVQANQTIRELFTGSTVAVLVDGVMLVGYLALMLVFDRVLGGIVLAAGAIHVASYFISQRVAAAAAEEAQRKKMTATTALLGVLGAVPTIKAAGIEERSHARWFDVNVHSMNADARLADVQRWIGLVPTILRYAVPLLILGIGGVRAMSGEISPGTLVSFQMLQAGFLGPLESLIGTLTNLAVVPTLLHRMDDVLSTPPEPNGSEMAGRLEGAIELEDVSFAYGPRSALVLDRMSIKIAAGSKVAFVGASGSGKSTVARLILGFYEPQKGRVLIDGVDLSKLDRGSVRRQYGVVMQEAMMFEGTIADNIRLYHPSLSTEEVVMAARAAQLHDDITALPNGYETRISSESGPLSGGQRQRLALARAIAHRPPVMILDEATSALDAPTEAAIQRYLATRACTRVVIAHRLNTVRDADVIYYLADGKIAESGTHDELVALGGRYAALVASEHEASAADVVVDEPLEPIFTADDLEAIPAFASLSSEHKTALSLLFDAGTFAEDDVILRQSEPAAGLHLLLQGRVVVELDEPGLPTWGLAELGAGEMLGELSLLDGEPSAASVVAKDKSVTMFLPQARYLQLTTSGNALGRRVLVALGALVAKRAQDAFRREGEVAKASPLARAEGAAHTATVRPLGATLVGACLVENEVPVLAAWAKTTKVKRGTTLFHHGANADHVYVLLSGRADLVTKDGVPIGASIDAGEDTAAWSVFSDAPHALSLVTTSDCEVVALSSDLLLDELEKGNPIARKVVVHFSRRIARELRLVNLRLRERAATENGELDRAHAAREASRAAARADRNILASDERIPFVKASDAAQSRAACLTALLRLAGRPAAIAIVEEALSVAQRGADPVVHAARSFGWVARPLVLSPGELASASAPTLLETKDHGAVLAIREKRRFVVMNPRSGVSVMTPAQLEATSTLGGYELEPKIPADAGGLGRRLATFARAESGALGRLAVVTVAVQLGTMLLATLVGVVVGTVLPSGDRTLLRNVILAAAVLAAASTAFQLLQSKAITYLQAAFDKSMLNQVMAHVLRLPMTFFDRNASGDVLRRFFAFEDVRITFSNQGVAAVLSVVSFAIGGVLLLLLDSSFFVIAAAQMFVYGVVVRVFFGRAHREAALARETRSKEQSRLLELLRGVAAIRLAGDDAAAIDRWYPAFKANLVHTTALDRIFSNARTLMSTTQSLGYLLAIATGAKAVASGTLSTAAFIGGLGVLGSFFASLHALAQQVLVSAPTVVDLGTVHETFAEPPEQPEGTRNAPGRLQGAVALERVSFRYTADGPLVLDDVSLYIEPGSKVALVGKSGSGKSTLGRLLIGMYLPTSGRIVLDKKDLANLDLAAVRQQVGVVLQEPHMVAGSLRENIALAADGATYDEVIVAAKKAAIHDDIEKLPMSYQTVVTEGGGTFSGGQRQRCVVARALLTDPSMLLLDEATSALDNKSQRAIEANLSHLAATRIVIAHRLSTVRNADKIVVVDRGRIAESGTHDELLARKGAYYALVESQMS